MSEREEAATAKPVLKSVNSVYLPASDPKASVRWYERHFGLTHPLGPNSDILQLADGTWLFLEKAIGRTTSNFATSGWVEGGNYEMFALCFTVDDAEELHVRLCAEGVRVEKLRDEGGCGLQFVFYDPDGNKFQVYQPPRRHK